jgi:predicted RNase H-like HicB family nuclease
LPGCISEGDTKEEAIENIKEAIELYLESDVEISADNPNIEELELAI